MVEATRQAGFSVGVYTGDEKLATEIGYADMLDQFKRGDLDVLLVPKDNTAILMKNKEVAPEYRQKGIEVQLASNMDTTYIGFNLENKFLKNKKLRQAMSLAYDTSRSLQIFFSCLSLPAHGPIPPSLEGYRADFKNPYSHFDL